MYKVVIDTNIFVSASLRGGKPRKVIEEWYKGEIELFISNEIIEEILKVLASPKINAPYSYIQLLGEVLYIRAKVVRPTQKLNIIKEDIADNKFLECAIEGKVKFIISGNHHLLNLKEYKGIKIVTPSQFLKILKQSE